MNFSRSNPLQIIALDDQQIFLRGVAAIFDQEPDLKLLGGASGCTELAALINQTEADMLLMECALSPQQNNGLNLIRDLHRQYPQLNILVMSSFYSSNVVSMALRNGAKGFINKQASEDELINAVKVVGGGNVYLELEMAVLLAQLHQGEMQATLPHEEPQNHPTLTATLSSLSPKVQEVMSCLLAGMTVTEIAHKFARSIKTISGQKQAGMRKLGLKTENDLYRLRYSLNNSSERT